jgi:choline dehydrogenase-like flavoprotein
MLKVLAQFPTPVGGLHSVLPLVQVTEFAPDISLGGSYLTPGHAAVLLADNWQQSRGAMGELEHVAAYYVAVRGRGTGSVRPTVADPSRSTARYALSLTDTARITEGLGHLVALLFAAGAQTVHTGVTGMPALHSVAQARALLAQPLPAHTLNLSTVHAFSSCPIGERRARTAADSFGRVWGWDNLILADASCLPSSPGVNPQATVMALARRNALAWLAEPAHTP